MIFGLFALTFLQRNVKINFYFQIPNTEEEWRVIELGFNTRWNFPGCVGVIDGKHMNTQASPNSGSDFLNYKSNVSIILLGVVDHDYCFHYIDFGSKERASDGDVFCNRSLKHAVENNSLSLPDDTIFVADNAFPLHIFNFRKNNQVGEIYLHFA